MRILIILALAWLITWPIRKLLRKRYPDAPRWLF